MSAYPAASKPTAAQVRVQRDRILASKVFSLSKRQSAFLDYVINTALEGRADKIKEFTLAVEVFGRDESFDPGVDSIVRVEASRLRAKLREYYADEGQADLVRIDVPKGHYVPVFDFAASEGSRPEEGVDKKQPTIRRSIRGRNRVLLTVLVVATGFLLFDRFFIDNETRLTPSAGSVGSQKTIAVLPFVNRSTNQSDVFFVDGIHDDLLTQLARIGSWKVISRTSVERFRGTTQSAPEIGFAARPVPPKISCPLSIEIGTLPRVPPVDGSSSYSRSPWRSTA